MTRLIPLTTLVGILFSGCTVKPPAQDREYFEDTTSQLEQRDQQVDSYDMQILQRAKIILSDPDKWDKADDRQCASTDTTWSLFCALQMASIEILGEYQHRRVAMQEVRFAIEDVSSGREFDHRLMDFNNIPGTAFEDLHEVLNIALGRVRSRLKTDSD